MTLTALGLALIEKSSDTGALTASEMVVAWLRRPPGPTLLPESSPSRVEDAVAMVKVELPPAVTAVGLNVAVAPAGSPLALKLTVCAEPLTRAVVMLDVTPCP